MAKKDEISMAKAVALKRLRARVRTEMAVRGDLILNDILPDFEAEFDRRVAAGEAYELTSYDAWVVDAVYARLPVGVHELA